MRGAVPSIGFNIFFLRLNETSAQTRHILGGFIELVGLPPTLHSENDKNFKKGLFKRFLQKFGIIPTYTETHLSSGIIP